VEKKQITLSNGKAGGTLPIGHGSMHSTQFRWPVGAVSFVSGLVVTGGSLRERRDISNNGYVGYHGDMSSTLEGPAGFMRSVIKSPSSGAVRDHRLYLP